MNMQDAAEAAVDSHQQSLREIWRLVRLVRADSSLGEEERKELLSTLYAPLSVKDMREFFVADGAKYDIGVSFRSSMSNMMRVKKRMSDIGYRIAGGANSKSRDREFAQRLGVRTPKLISENVPIESVELTPGTIIKPMRGAGSRGVFFVAEDLSLRSVKTRKRYKTLRDAQVEYEPLLSAKAPLNWIVEEAIVGVDGGLAPDVKVYMFYGIPGVYIKIRRGVGDAGSAQHVVYDAEGDEIGFSRHFTRWDGGGVPEGVLASAQQISLATPIPFLRIDFLEGVNGCVLGEITPHPGGTYAGDIYDDVDKSMGRLFLEAEARLKADLIEGKQFDEYFSVYRSPARERDTRK